MFAFDVSRRRYICTVARPGVRRAHYATARPRSCSSGGGGGGGGRGDGRRVLRLESFIEQWQCDHVEPTARVLHGACDAPRGQIGR
jgi:hypothetical protein